MNDIFKKKKFEKVRFVSYYCTSSLNFHFLKEDEKKKVTKKKRFFTA